MFRLTIAEGKLAEAHSGQQLGASLPAEGDHVRVTQLPASVSGREGRECKT